MKKVRVYLRGGHYITFTADTESSDEAYAFVRDKIAQSSPFEGDNGAYIRIERMTDVIMTEIV